MREVINELGARSGFLGFATVLGGRSRSFAAFFGRLCFFDDFAFNDFAAATAIATSVTTAIAAAIATAVATAVTAAFATAAMMPVLTAAAVVTIATAVAAAFAFASGLLARRFACGFTLRLARRFALGLAARRLVARVMRMAMVPTATAAMATASFGLRFQTHEDDGQSRQAQGHAHKISLHRGTSINLRNVKPTTLSCFWDLRNGLVTAQACH
jgi:hypothetical protein